LSRPSFCAIKRAGACMSYLAAVALVAGCAGGLSSLSDMKIGDRPLFYKNQPGDAPETIENQAGRVGKKQEVPPPPARSAEAIPPAAGGPAPAQIASRGDTPGGARERPAQVAQAAPAPRAAPAAQGGMPGGYTQASRYGDLLFVSGQIALDPRTGAFDGDASIEVQTQRVLDNVRAILESNQLTMANIVSVTIYLSSLNNLVAMDRAYTAYFRQSLPARSIVEVAKLPRGALIEISAIAGR
jgi:2-iminobutanoate/2-iminopropanoate deaminase